MNERELIYKYSFKCEDDLEHFEKLPEKMQADIEKYIVKVITDSFVTPADEDYVTARFLAQKGMHRAFFWAASQALEKYLKAFLLMRGIAVNKKRFRGHPIVALHQEACSIEKQLSSVKTKPNEAIKIHSAVAESVDIFSVSDFINNIEAYGNPDNRYNSFGVNFNSGYLFALDSYVFGLRQLIGVPSIQETLRKMDQSLIEAFYEYNPWFESTNIDFAEIPNENFNITTSVAVTTLDFLTGIHAPNEAKLSLQWLETKMKLPNKVSKHLKKA
ncbi:hypothetical protein [Vibrio sp. MA40-2]|uniref:hypothetical protein n=1 Tax=Vibrio sp. MA40-2 TaxID=3391828 RepID=UPI0039A755BD